MLFGPAVVSSSSGMCVRAIEPDASISSMMLGFTAADVDEAIGLFEMSVGAACDDDAIASATTTAARDKTRLCDAMDGWTCFMMLDLVRRPMPYCINTC